MNTSKPIRLCSVIDNFSSGGAQTFLIHLTAGLAESGYNLTAILLNDGANPALVERLERHCRVIQLGKLRLLTTGLYTLWKEFRRCDVLQTILPVSDLLGRILGRLAGARRILTLIRARNTHKGPLRLWLDRRTMHLADRVVCNSRSALEFARKREGAPEDRLLYIPNGVRSLTPDPEVDLRSRLDPSGSAWIIGSMGRLNFQKGYDVLLEAFARLASSRPNWILAVAGDGPLRNTLEDQARRLGVASRVHFVGLVDNAANFLAALNLYVQPSRFEGMPNATMEAMMAGLPVIATRVDGALDILEDGVTGVLTDMDRPDQLESALQRLAGDRDAAQELGRNARERMERDFSVETMVARYDALYRELLAGPPNAQSK